MKSMKLFGGLLLACALVALSCRAAEEEEGQSVGSAKVYDFSIRNVTPSRPIWVAIKTYKPGKIVDKSTWEKIKEYVKGKKGCSLEKYEIKYTKLDTKKPVLKKKFVGQIRVFVTSEKKDPKAEYQKCEVLKEAKEEGETYLSKNKKINLNPGKPLNKGGEDLDSFDEELGMSTFHVDVAVLKDGDLDIHPSVSTPKVKIPSNNISKEKLRKYTLDTKEAVANNTDEEEIEDEEEPEEKQ